MSDFIAIAATLSGMGSIFYGADLARRSLVKDEAPKFNRPIKALLATLYLGAGATTVFIAPTQKPEVATIAPKSMQHNKL